MAMIDEKIIDLFLQGFTRPKIAVMLNLSKQAIDKRLTKLFKKYDAKNKAEFIRKITMLQVFHEIL